MSGSDDTRENPAEVKHQPGAPTAKLVSSHLPPLPLPLGRPCGQGACKEQRSSFPVRTVCRSFCHSLNIHVHLLNINIYENSLNMCQVCDYERIVEINYFL